MGRGAVQAGNPLLEASGAAATKKVTKLSQILIGEEVRRLLQGRGACLGGPVARKVVRFISKPFLGSYLPPARPCRCFGLRRSPAR